GAPPEVLPDLRADRLDAEDVVGAFAELLLEAALDRVGYRAAAALLRPEDAYLELLPALPDVLHHDLAELRPRERGSDVADRGRLRELHVHHRPAREVDAVIEPALQPHRREADRDQGPRQDQHLEAKPDEIDLRPGRDQFEETVLDGRRFLRAADGTRRHGTTLALHTLTVVTR